MANPPAKRRTDQCPGALFPAEVTNTHNLCLISDVTRKDILGVGYI